MRIVLQLGAVLMTHATRNTVNEVACCSPGASLATVRVNNPCHMATLFPGGAGGMESHLQGCNPAETGLERFAHPAPHPLFGCTRFPMAHVPVLQQGAVREGSEAEADC